MTSFGLGGEYLEPFCKAESERAAAPSPVPHGALGEYRVRRTSVLGACRPLVEVFLGDSGLSWVASSRGGGAVRLRASPIQCARAASVRPVAPETAPLKQGLSQADRRPRLRCRIAALGLEGYASRQTAPFVGCALQMPNGSPDHTASSLWLRPRSVSPAMQAKRLHILLRTSAHILRCVLVHCHCSSFIRPTSRANNVVAALKDEFELQHEYVIQCQHTFIERT